MGTMSERPFHNKRHVYFVVERIKPNRSGMGVAFLLADASCCIFTLFSTHNWLNTVLWFDIIANPTCAGWRKFHDT